ncbi:TPA: TraI/MobA(P) family conjugative relaxase [Legionella pneumophila]
MIVRHIPMKVIKKSSFAGLIQYMTNEHGKQERVGEIRVTNCQSNEVDWAIHEVQATQALNQRAQGDRTYHLLISFPAGEVPSTDVLKDIEERVCTSIGFGEHQRISVVHYDTDNFHIHVGINKIHPTRYTLHEPYLAYRKLGEMATLLEIEHGLQQVNHIPFKIGSENRADDMEHHAGIGSLLNWIKSECLEQIQGATNWSELHRVMQRHGLELREQGRGLVIIDGSGVGVKASSVSRDFSKQKLQQRLGVFEKSESIQSSHNLLEMMSIDSDIHYAPRPIHMNINTTELFARYQAEQSNSKIHCAAELAKARVRKNQLIASAMRTGRLKRAAIKLLGGAHVNKKALYNLTSQALKTEIAQAKKNYLTEREAIYIQFQRCVWADWLKLKATEGDVEALSVLRARDARQPLKGDVFTGQKTQNSSPSLDASPDNITKTGTIIYRAGASAIRDDGEFLKISRGSSEEAIATALRMAIHRFGACISVKGSNAFKEQVAQTAADLKINITFDDAALEQRRQYLIKTSVKEKNNESKRQSELKRRGANRGRNEGFGTVRTIESPRRANRNNGWPSKPHIGRIGHQPPPESKNRLRSLSQLGVVQLTKRGEVLLPGHVSGHLEHQGAQPDNGLRRNVSGAGTVDFISKAADKYIAERELKRQKIANIPLHRRYHSSDEGLVRFVGLRHVEQEPLALLQRGEHIIVLPIDAATARRMKHLSIGADLTLGSNGVVRLRGRSR